MKFLSEKIISIVWAEQWQWQVQRQTPIPEKMLRKTAQLL